MPSYFLDILSERYDALIVANGTPPRRRLLSLLRKRSDHLVAVDGGLNSLFRQGLAPDHVVGDLDSATPAALDWAKAQGAKVHYRPAVDAPDFVKGLRLCVDLGYRHNVAAGLAGGRIDHVLSTLYISLYQRGLEIVLVTDEVAAFPLRGRVNRVFQIPERHTLSWFAAPEAGPCSLGGVRWPFRNRMLRPQGFHSLSNQPLSEPVTLSQRAGRSVFVVSLFPQIAE